MLAHPSLDTLSRDISFYSTVAVQHFDCEFPISRKGRMEFVERIRLMERLIFLLEKITWLEIPDNQTRQVCLNLLEIAKKYYDKEKRFSTSFGQKKPVKIVKNFLFALDDLQETIDDVESIITPSPGITLLQQIFEENLNNL